MPIRVGEPLSLEDVVEVASGAEVALGSGALGRIGAARDVVERAVASNATVYGVTTGFGSLANERIEPQQADALQLGIVRSHATAVGPPLSREEARARSSSPPTSRPVPTASGSSSIRRTGASATPS